MAWSVTFAPATDQRHHRYNADGLTQVNASTVSSRRIPLVPDLVLHQLKHPRCPPPCGHTRQMLWRSVELFGVERDEGVVGWGEATDHGHPVSLA